MHAGCHTTPSHPQSRYAKGINREVLNQRQVPQDPLDAIDVEELLLHWKRLLQLERCWIRLTEHLRWPAGQPTDRHTSTTQTIPYRCNRITPKQHRHISTIQTIQITTRRSAWLSHGLQQQTYNPWPALGNWQQHLQLCMSRSNGCGLATPSLSGLIGVSNVGCHSYGIVNDSITILPPATAAHPPCDACEGQLRGTCEPQRDAYCTVLQGLGPASWPNLSQCGSLCLNDCF